MYSNSPGIPYGHQGDITIWAELQDAVLRLDPDPKQLDVLRRVRTHTRVLLHTGGGQIKETVMRDLKIITPNILFQLSGRNLKSYEQKYCHLQKNPSVSDYLNSRIKPKQQQA